MNRTKLAIVALLAMIAITSAAQGTEDMPQDELLMIPEPTLGSVMSGKYQFDREATNAYYNQLFDGKTAEECISFLEDRNTVVLYDTPARISFFVERRLLVISYSALIALHFDKGVFLRSEVTGYGIL